MPQLDPSLCYFGSEAILLRLEEMLRVAGAVRAGEDTVAVHDMRVASRRARTALDLFVGCFPASKAKSWNKQLKRVTRALGEARDADVQIEFLTAFLKATADRKLRPGIRRLLLRIAQHRRDCQGDVVAALERFESHGDLAQMQSALLQQKARGCLHRMELTSPALYQHACDCITVRLEEMLAFEQYVNKPECGEQLHAMRIAAKHLRYAMEVFEPLFDGGLKEFVAKTRQVQKRLGKIHDDDVWIAMLPLFEQQERHRTIDYFGREGPVRPLLPGLAHLLEDRCGHRDAAYQTFIACWQKIQNHGLWGDLLELLESRCPATDAMASAPVAPEPPL